MYDAGSRDVLAANMPLIRLGSLDEMARAQQHVAFDDSSHLLGFLRSAVGQLFFARI